TENTFGIGQGWVEKGDRGIFEQAIYGELDDGALVTDEACAAAVSRGDWQQDALGDPRLELIPLDAGVDARAFASECPIGSTDAGRDH
ncbi:MAG TPA: hypothetical protein VHU80_17390, partial [Polyangiaceae bacterium]|nr:hypothetical protein [Polyangiaceae bacterium]